MAASDTVGTIGGAIGGIASMVPGYGTAIGAGISGITSLVSGLMKNSEAQEQAKRAEQLRKQSQNLQMGQLRPEYLKALKMNEMSALYGIPGINQYEQGIDRDVANNARAIVESSPDGGLALNAINATLNKAYQAKNQLYQQDALAREGKMAKVADMVWNTGDKAMDLVAMQRADKRDLNAAAMNLENSATANKIGSMDQILSTVGATAGTLGKFADYNANGATGRKPVVLQDGTQISPEMIAAFYAALNKTGGILPQ